MKAIHVTRLGDATTPATLALVDAPDAPPFDAKSDTLLLRVLACALCPGDVKFLSGALSGRAVPSAPGLEVCGVVERVGTATAASGRFRVGDRVVAALRARQGQGPASHGGLAQRVIVEAALAAVVPAAVSTLHAVALPLAGAMALQTVKDASISAGARVLVLGASSCVGRLVVQLAKRAGAAFVAGTTPRKELAAALPQLDLVIVDDGQCAPWYDHDFGAKPRFDVVVDCAGERDAWRHADKVLVPRGGRLAVLLSEMVSEGDVRATSQLLSLGFVGMWKSFWRAGAKMLLVGQFPTADSLRELLALAEARELSPTLDDATPLAFTPEAVQRGLARLTHRQHSGAVVVTIAEEDVTAVGSAALQ